MILTHLTFSYLFSVFGIWSQVNSFEVVFLFFPGGRSFFPLSYFGLFFDVGVV